LAEKSRQSEFAALVVGFEEQTQFAWRGRADAALRLDSLLGAGGKDMGVLGADVAGNAIVYSVQPFPEYAGDETIRRYLAVVGDQIMEAFKQRWQTSRN